MQTSLPRSGPTALPINRRPIDEPQKRFIPSMSFCDIEAVSDARDLLFANLEAANYPIHEIETISVGDGQVELAAGLVPTTAEPAELDAVLDSLKQSATIKSATWTVSMTS